MKVVALLICFVPPLVSFLWSFVVRPLLRDIGEEEARIRERTAWVYPDRPTIDQLVARAWIGAAVPKETFTIKPAYYGWPIENRK